MAAKIHQWPYQPLSDFQPSMALPDLYPGLFNLSSIAIAFAITAGMFFALSVLVKRPNVTIRHG